MFACAICHFRTELDDAVVTHGSQCICLRCYGRETETTLVMPATLRHWLDAALAALEAP